jgi:hypothetical protein
MQFINDYATFPVSCNPAVLNLLVLTFPNQTLSPILTFCVPLRLLAYPRWRAPGVTYPKDLKTYQGSFKMPLIDLTFSVQPF